jgi:hypothetical protein
MFVRTLVIYDTELGSVCSTDRCQTLADLFQRCREGSEPSSTQVGTCSQPVTTELPWAHPDLCWRVICRGLYGGYRQRCRGRGQTGPRRAAHYPRPFSRVGAENPSGRVDLHLCQSRRHLGRGIWNCAIYPNQPPLAGCVFPPELSAAPVRNVAISRLLWLCEGRVGQGSTEARRSEGTAADTIAPHENPCSRCPDGFSTRTARVAGHEHGDRFRAGSSATSARRSVHRAGQCTAPVSARRRSVHGAGQCTAPVSARCSPTSCGVSPMQPIIHQPRAQ